MPDDPTIGVDERELDDLALEALAEAYATTPPADLRRRVLAEARTSAPASTGHAARRALGRWRAVGALAATLALVLGGLLVRTRQELAATDARRVAELAALDARRAAEVAALERSNGELTARLDQQERRLVGLRTALEAQAQVLRVLGGPRTVTAALAPQEGRTGTGQVHVDPDTGEGAVVLAGVPALDPGRVYELWALRGDAPPEPAGLLEPAEGDVLVARVPTLARPGEVTAFAVSIEPTGGSKSPTGPIVLVGAVKS